MIRSPGFRYRRAGQGAYHVWSSETLVWVGSVCRTARGGWVVVDPRGRVVLFEFPGSLDSAAGLLRSRFEQVCTAKGW